MCLAMPAKVVSVDPGTDRAKVMLGEIGKDISLALVEDVQVGDFVLVHVGFALHKISETEAEKTLQLFREAGLISGHSDSDQARLPGGS